MSIQNGLKLETLLALTISLNFKIIATIRGTNVLYCIIYVHLFEDKVIYRVASLLSNEWYQKDLWFANVYMNKDIDVFIVNPKIKNINQGYNFIRTKMIKSFY